MAAGPSARVHRSGRGVAHPIGRSAPADHVVPARVQAPAHSGAKHTAHALAHLVPPQPRPPSCSLPACVRLRSGPARRMRRALCIICACMCADAHASQAARPAGEARWRARSTGDQRRWRCGDGDVAMATHRGRRSRGRSCARRRPRRTWWRRSGARSRAAPRAARPPPPARCRAPRRFRRSVACGVNTNKIAVRSGRALRG